MTVRIRSIELREIRLALKEPFRISSGVTHERRILLVRLEDVDGTEAWGECVAAENPNYSYETIDTARLVIARWVAPAVLQQPFAHPRALSDALDVAFRGHPMAKAAVEMPSWALLAAKHGIALAELLGGNRDVIEVGISLGIQPTPADLVRRACAARDQGYRRIKLKIQPGSDIEFVAAVRDALGPHTPLSVDANSAYSLDDVEHLHRLDAFDLLMIEQPLPHDDLVRHAELQRVVRTAICLDESITGPRQAEDMLKLGSGRIINIKPGRAGGLARSVAIHDLAQANDVPVWCGGMLETGIGRAYNVALSSLPNFRLPGDQSPSARYWERDIVIPEWTMEKGLVRVPRDRPGLGVAIDADRVDDLTIDRQVVSA